MEFYIFDGSGRIILVNTTQHRMKYDSMRQVLTDHLKVLTIMPTVAMAAFQLTPKQSELTHVSVNSIHKCVFCTLLHCELARMSGWLNPLELMAVTSEVANESLTKEDSAIRIYAQQFAKEPHNCNYSSLAEAIGESSARNVCALCWFLHWGATSGNLIMGTLMLKPSKMNPLARVLFCLYYAPLFILIVAVGNLLKLFPSKGPKFVNQALGVVLAICASIWILPIGIFASICTC